MAEAKFGGLLNPDGVKDDVVKRMNTLTKQEEAALSARKKAAIDPEQAKYDAAKDRQNLTTAQSENLEQKRPLKELVTDFFNPKAVNVRTIPNIDLANHVIDLTPYGMGAKIHETKGQEKKYYLRYLNMQILVQEMTGDIDDFKNQLEQLKNPV